MLLDTQFFGNLRNLVLTFFFFSKNFIEKEKQPPLHYANDYTSINAHKNQ